MRAAFARTPSKKEQPARGDAGCSGAEPAGGDRFAGIRSTCRRSVKRCAVRKCDAGNKQVLVAAAEAARRAVDPGLLAADDGLAGQRDVAALHLRGRLRVAVAEVRIEFRREREGHGSEDESGGENGLDHGRISCSRVWVDVAKPIFPVFGSVAGRLRRPTDGAEIRDALINWKSRGVAKNHEIRERRVRSFSALCRRFPGRVATVSCVSRRRAHSRKMDRSEDFSRADAATR